MDTDVYVRNNARRDDRLLAKQTKKILEELQLINPSKGNFTQVFYTNSNPEVLKKIVKPLESVFYKDF